MFCQQGASFEAETEISSYEAPVYYDPLTDDYKKFDD